MYALLSAEQEDLKQTSRQLAERIGLRNPSDIETYEYRSGWEAVSHIGFTSLRHREGDSPIGSGVDVSVVAEAFGAWLVPQPFVAASVCASELLEAAGSDRSTLDQSATTEPFAIALTPDLVRFAEPENTVAIWGAAMHNNVLSIARTQNETMTVVHHYIEGDVANGSADLTQHVSQGHKLGSGEVVGGVTSEDIARTLALTLTAVSADTVGLMRQALQGAVDYSKDRIAYGVPTGSFQAIQHMSAECLVMIEGVSGAVNYAAWCVDERNAAEALLAARTAKARAAAVARTVTENIMQIYGGIGQTWEHIAHFYTRRALMNTQLLGPEDYQLDHIADARLEGN